MKRRLVTGRLEGEIDAPASKSYSHRWAIICALAGGGRVCKALQADDLLVTVNGLKSLGYNLQCEAGSIAVLPSQRPAGEVWIDAGESGTSARFLTALAALNDGPVHLTGRGRMNSRPFRPLLDVLAQLGVDCRHSDGFPPLEIRGPLRHGGVVAVEAAQSSQFVSALMLIAPLLESGLHIHLRGPVSSRPYIDVTADCMRRAGIEVQLDETEIRIPAGTYRPGDYEVEGDWSNASYWMLGAALSGGRLQIGNLAHDSVQGDRRLLDILQSCGVHIEYRTNSRHDFFVLHRAGNLQPFKVDLTPTPDLAPGLAVLALFCDGVSTLDNVGILRHKESDRLEALLLNLQALGAVAESDGRSLKVAPPRAPRGAPIRTFGDHRIAMSFALAGLCIPGIELDDASVVNKSYPQFWRDYDSLLVETGE